MKILIQLIDFHWLPYIAIKKATYYDLYDPYKYSLYFGWLCVGVKVSFD